VQHDPVRGGDLADPGCVEAGDVDLRSWLAARAGAVSVTDT